MSRKSQKTSSPRSDKADRSRLPDDAVKVSAVNSTRGRPATTIHVEVDNDKVRKSHDDFDEVDEVMAELPEREEGKDTVRWSSERLQKDRQGAGPAVHFSGTHYGPSDTTKYGLSVKVKAKSTCTVEAKGVGGEVSVREVDKPEPPALPRSQPKGKK